MYNRSIYHDSIVAISPKFGGIFSVVTWVFHQWHNVSIGNDRLIWFFVDIEKLGILPHSDGAPRVLGTCPSLQTDCGVYAAMTAWQESHKDMPLISEGRGTREFVSR
jgi:hypothetical protein